MTCAPVPTSRPPLRCQAHGTRPRARRRAPMQRQRPLPQDVDTINSRPPRALQKKTRRGNIRTNKSTRCDGCTVHRTFQFQASARSGRLNEQQRRPEPEPSRHPQSAIQLNYQSVPSGRRDATRRDATPPSEPPANIRGTPDRAGASPPAARPGPAGAPPPYFTTRLAGGGERASSSQPVLPPPRRLEAHARPPAPRE